MGANALVTFQAGNLCGADVILFDKGILCDALFLHNLPKIVIRNHISHPPLDIITEFGI